MISEREREFLAQHLRHQRENLQREIATFDLDAERLREESLSEFEERARTDRTRRLDGRLDERGRREIEEIDAALQRLEEGVFGSCQDCGAPISSARLRAVPTVRRCIDCAAVRETQHRTGGDVEATNGPVPAIAAELSDEQIASTLAAQLRGDKRVPPNAIEVHSRAGVIHLEGTLASENEHQILRKVVSDFAGFQEIVDNIRIDAGLREDQPRDRDTTARERNPEELLSTRPTDLLEEVPGGAATERRRARRQTAETEDSVRSDKEGIGYSAPDRPLPDET